MAFNDDMRVTSINNTACFFKSRKPEIRKADDIHRRARKEFPLLSTTYIDMFYNCIQESNPDENRQLRADYITSKLDKKIMSVRRDAEPIGDSIACYIPYARTLKTIKEIKAGNCAESAASVIAALAANGIYDSQMSNLGLSIEFINKKNNKSEYKVIEPIDHSLVVTAMNKNNPKEKDFVVIDSWLGFTDSISGAKSRYKNVYNDEYMSPEIKANRSLFRLNNYEKTGKFINYDDYDIRTRIVIYKSPDRYDRDNLSDLGIYCRRNYPNLVTDKSVKNNESIRSLLHYLQYISPLEQL